MKNAAIARLAGRTPEDIAEKARVPFDGTTFLLDTLGMHIRVQYPEYHMTPQLHDWHTLAVLHYLDLADGTPRTGKWMNFSQQKRRAWFAAVGLIERWSSKCKPPSVSYLQTSCISGARHWVGRRSCPTPIIAANCRFSSCIQSWLADMVCRRGVCRPSDACCWTAILRHYLYRRRCCGCRGAFRL
ncbi:MAG: DUF3786 domain-containing protein [Oscillospiraceae bacterium]